MWLSYDAARLPLVPTLCTTVEVQGHRPLGGLWDKTDHVSCCAALTLVTGQLTTRVLD